MRWGFTQKAGERDDINLKFRKLMSMVLREVFGRTYVSRKRDELTSVSLLCSLLDRCNFPLTVRHTVLLFGT